MDGTLYDVAPQRRKIWRHLLGHPRILRAWKEEFEGLRGSVHADLHGELLRRVAERSQATEGRVGDVLRRVLGEAWPASFDERTPLPGMATLLAALRERGVPLAAVSDHPARQKLERMGLSRAFASVVDCSALGALKPHPLGLIAAAEAIGLAPARLVHVGDRDDTDGGMARAAGAAFLLRGRDWRSVEELSERLQALLPAR